MKIQLAVSELQRDFIPNIMIFQYGHTHYIQQTGTIDCRAIIG